MESNTVDKAALGRYIRSHLGAIQGCYERELKLNPALKGKITVRFVVTTAGRVGDASIDDDSVHDDAVSSCVLMRIRNWVFNFHPDEDAPVIFPFIFHPGG